MSAPNESTSLLGAELRSDRRSNGPSSVNINEVSTQYDSDEEMAQRGRVDVLFTRYGSPAESMGLSGGGGIYGSSLLSHKASMTFSDAAVSQVPSRSSSLRRRPSIRSLEASAVPSKSSRTTPNPLGLAKKPSRSEAAQDAASPIQEEDENDVEAVQAEKVPKFKYGVSEGRFWAMFFTILIVWLVACFDGTLMASSHPVITSYFDASNLASWLSTSFFLTQTSFQPMFARLSDSFGRRPLFLIPLAAFGLGTLWCALAQSIISFIVARAVCGLGAGGVIALGAIIISDLVPLHHRASYLSVLNLSYGIGSALGAALGGLMADRLGWRWEFGIQIPAFAVGFIVAYFSVPDGLGPCLAKHTGATFWQSIRNFDIAGSLLLTISIICLILGLNLGGNVLPWSHPLIIISLLCFGILGTALLFVEREADRPVMPLHLLFQIPRGNIILSNFLNCMTMNTILFNIPLYFQATLLDTPTRSGTRLVPPFVVSMFAAFFVGNIITYTRMMKIWLVLGFVCILLGAILLAIMKRTYSEWVFSQLISVSMVGQGLGFPTSSMALLAVSAPEDMAVATSTQMLFRTLGGVMGVAVSSLVFQNTLVLFLDRYVSGSERASVIIEARKSVENIVKLADPYREQVIEAYAAALRLTFWQGVATSAIALLLVLWITIPRLKPTPVKVQVTQAD